MIATIADLPFRERPLLDLLNLVTDRSSPDPDYVGFGWARAPRIWLVETGAARAVDDALVLALHCPDDGALLTSDIELYFEVVGHPPVTVLASAFFARWLPRLPDDATSIVLALCNPHHASLPQPEGTRRPLHFAHGEVSSWQARDAGRIELRAASWHRPEIQRRRRAS